MLFLRIFALLSIASFLSACSVFSAVHVEEMPDLSVLRPGASQAMVETELTNRIKTVRMRHGKQVEYHFFSGDEPSYSRAITYAVLDAATLGLAEIATTPIESLQGNRHIVRVTYDRQDRVRFVEHLKIDAPLPKPEKALGLEVEGPVNEDGEPILEKAEPSASEIEADMLARRGKRNRK